MCFFRLQSGIRWAARERARPTGWHVAFFPLAKAGFTLSPGACFPPEKKADRRKTGGRRDNSGSFFRRLSKAGFTLSPGAFPPKKTFQTSRNSP